jgi:F-type H+-transporting ATPase subunit delta
VADYKNIQQVVLTAATRVDPALVEQVKNLTQESTGSAVEIIQRVNPALIGGFVLNIGDKQFDSSIATRIKRVKRKLTETKI